MVLLRAPLAHRCRLCAVVQFHSVARRGDAIIAGFNFGTGSSREQAATCIKHFGSPLVIAGSFNETYKRNALNNALVVIECAALVRLLQGEFGKQSSTHRLADSLVVDFERGVIQFRQQEFAFVVPGEVAQNLIVSGGLEAIIAKTLTAKRAK